MMSTATNAWMVICWHYASDKVHKFPPYTGMPLRMGMQVASAIDQMQQLHVQPSPASFRPLEVELHVDT